VGWKLAFGIPAVEHVQGGMPMLGYLTTATQLPPGGTFRCQPSVDLRFETELAVQVAAADAEGSYHAVGAVAVALEIVNVGQPQHDLEDVTTENVLHKAFALGPQTNCPIKSLDATASVNGLDVERATQTPQIRQALAQAARLLETAEERLTPGDWLLCGSLTHTTCRPGDSITAAISEIGAVTLTLI
jgi:2-keto-4-pentenoate hydratase